MADSKMGGPKATSPDATSPGAAGAASGAQDMGAKMTAPPSDVVGKDIVNNEGDTIGEIESVSDNQVIVSVGGFLGIGDRKVALGWDQITQTGTGKDAKLMTSKTKEELKMMPEYKE
ncbi:MAG: PRC-barrel domain-containing protein [Rhodospirillales bacterium]